jgi:site-specific recombinase XerD
MNDLLKTLSNDLQLADYSPRTVEAYLYGAKKFLEYFNKPPNQITEDDIKRYFLFLKNTKKYSASAATQAICGIKFLYKKTLNMDFKVFGIVRNRRGKKLPVVLSREEVKKILSNIRILRHRACLTTIYSCGLRLHEATYLNVKDIDSNKMLIHIKEGKGKNDRYVPLPEAALKLLRKHYATHKNPSLIFPAPGRGGVFESYSIRPLPDSSIQTVFKKSLREVKINKDAHVHTLRHSYATHLLEDEVDIRVIHPDKQAVIKEQLLFHFKFNTACKSGRT